MEAKLGSKRIAILEYFPSVLEEVSHVSLEVAEGGDGPANAARGCRGGEVGHDATYRSITVIAPAIVVAVVAAASWQGIAHVPS